MSFKKVFHILLIAAYLLFPASIFSQANQTDSGDSTTLYSPMGKTWAVFIENSSYQHFSSLEGPTRDVMTMMECLSAYQIDEMIHKINLKKVEMDRFFSIELRDLIKENEVNSLLIWYAGHGRYLNETGYWVPVDGKNDDEFSFYGINSLRVSLQSYSNLTHLLVVTDACESGPAFVEVLKTNPESVLCSDSETLNQKSAQVLSSAGYELASDNSQFTKVFSSVLNSNTDNCVPIDLIATKVGGAVESTGNQSPKFGKIAGLDHQNGSFFFFR
jgi:uncharacterized caspase-like protein